MNPARTLALLLAVFPGGVLAPAARLGQSETAASPRARRPDAPIELVLSPYVGRLRTVLVRVGEREAPFLFDTGGGGTVLSLASAKAAGLTPFGRATGFRHDGGRVDGQRGGPIALSLGAFERRGEVGVLDLDAWLAGLPRVGGIVSLETFEGAALTVDLAHDRLFVESAASLAARTEHAPELVVRIGRQVAGAGLDLFVAIEGRHGPLWFELDSGNVAPVLVAPHAFAELGLEPLPIGATRSASLDLAGLGPVECEIQAKELIYDGLLNAAFFERHVITLDLASARAWARPEPPAKR